uniref:Glutamine amidotransferase-like class 1 domain-containing protein 1 n=1 Tax=Anas zonorhyncha TaxID=75864 RepID=A0A8B9UK96_9AVES
MRGSSEANRALTTRGNTGSGHHRVRGRRAGGFKRRRGPLMAAPLTAVPPSAPSAHAWLGRMRRRPPPPPPGSAMSERLGKPTCLIVASAAAAGVSAQSFLHCFTLTSSAFNLQVATPGGKSIDFVDVNESNMRWIQDFRMKSYANPAKLESIDGARYHALLIPNCPGAVTDLANSGYLAKILQHFSTENKPICAVGHGVAALCCATNEDKSWVFQGYSLTGPSVYELIRQPNFASLSIIVEDFVKDSGATFSASKPDAVHVVLDRHLVTGQNENSTLPAVQNLLMLCNVR